MARCYDPGRMASATSRQTRVLLRLGVLLRAIAWTFLAAVLAVAGSGLVARLWHPAGTPARAELTWLGDTVLSSALSASEPDVLAVADAVDQLADEARIALASAAAADPALLEASLSRGTIQVASIDAVVAALQETLRSVPGDGPDAAVWYRGDLVARRAALLAAVDAASELGSHWSAVKARSTDVAALLRLIADHDQRVLDAAAEGRAGNYRNAITILGEARDLLTAIGERRAGLVSGSEPTILDEWVDRNGTYNEALTALYEALRKTNGKVTPAVQAAARDEETARDQLPADRRAIVVIVSEIARGGLNQAVLAIEEVRGRIDAALAPPGS
jgi:hypothetical protein